MDEGFHHFKYATKVKCSGGPLDGNITVKPGRQMTEKETVRYVDDDNTVKAFMEKRIEVFELPRLMKAYEIEQWVKKHSEDGLLDALENSGDSDE